MIHLGANLLDEGLELGELTVNSQIEDQNLEPYFIIAYSGDSISWQGETTNIPQEGFSINGIPSSIAFLICNGEASYEAMISIINDDGQGDKIFTCFTVPKIVFSNYYDPYTLNLLETTNLPCCIISKGGYPAYSGNLTITKNTSLNGYTPRNKKLLTWPFNFLGMTCLNGDKKIYRFEDFSDTVSFKLLCEMNPNPRLIYRPLNYRNSTDGLNDVSSIDGYPTLAYKNDYYNTWLAQNSTIIKLQAFQEQNNYDAGLINSGANAVNNAITSAASIAPNENGNQNFTGAITGGVSSFNAGVQIGRDVINHEIYQKMLLAQKRKESLLPDTINLGSSATLLGYNLLSKNVFSIFSIKYRQAQILDNYFDMYRICYK